MASYHHGVALRLTALAAAALLAAGAVYVVRDRDHLAAEIRTHKVAYAACERAGGAPAACKRRDGWSHLAAVRDGDLLGLPFFALGALLCIILGVRITIGPPAPADTAGLDVTSTVVPE